MKNELLQPLSQRLTDPGGWNEHRPLPQNTIFGGSFNFRYTYKSYVPDLHDRGGIFQLILFIFGTYVL